MIGAVAEDETLARVREDLAVGRSALARQRLRGLVGTSPHRLDLREQLAELYRRDGVASQAGRWSFLSDTADRSEVAAFEREYADPVRRMKALAWRGPENAAGPEVAARLAAVRSEAEHRVGHPLSWDKLPNDEQPSTTWGDRLGEFVLFAVIGLFVLGGISFVIQGVKVLIGWLSG